MKSILLTLAMLLSANAMGATSESGSVAAVETPTVAANGRINSYGEAQNVTCDMACDDARADVLGKLQQLCPGKLEEVRYSEGFCASAEYLDDCSLSGDAICNETHG